MTIALLCMVGELLILMQLAHLPLRKQSTAALFVYWVFKARIYTSWAFTIFTEYSKPRFITKDHVHSNKVITQLNSDTGP